MVSIDPLHPAQSAILEVLGNIPALTIEELQKKITKNHSIEMSMPTLYRIVAQLIDEQVLVREKGKLSLNLVWVNHVLRLATQIETTYVTRAHPVFELPKNEGEKKEFTADSLNGLDPVWNHILLQLVKEREGNTWYEYASHPWFTLAMPGTEADVYKTILAQKTSVHLVHGNDTFLDRHAIKLLKKTLPSIRQTTAKNLPFPKEGYLVIVYGSYVIECFVADVVSKHFALFFNSVQSIEQFDPQMFSDVFRMKTQARIQIRKSTADSAALRNTLEKLF